MATTKKTYHHGDLRQALVKAALEITHREGVAAVGLRAVARAVGVSQTAPYRHFADKAALLAAAAEAGFVALGESLASTVAAATTADELLRAQGVAYVRFAADNPAWFRLMFGHEVGDRRQHSTLRAAATSAFSFLESAVVRGQEEGVVRQGEPRVLALSAWSLVHGLASLLVNDQLSEAGLGPDQAADLAQQVGLVLREGLAPRSEQPPVPSFW